MPESDEQIVTRLTRALEAAIPSAMGDGYRLTPDPPKRSDRRYSFVFRYWAVDSLGRRYPLFVKIPHPDSMTSLDEAIHSKRLGEEIEREFEVLFSIAEVIRRANCLGITAIQPMGFSLDFNAIFMEELQLTMLKDRLMEWGIALGNQRDWREFVEQIRRAGEWLKVIHDEFHHGRFCVLEDLGLERLIASEFDELEEKIGSNFRTVRKIFLQVYMERMAETVPISSLHDDFHLGNIFYMPDGRIGVLDPNWKDAGSVFQDLASILIDPITRKFQVLSYGLLFRQSFHHKYEQAVLRGYFGHQQPARLRLLNFYCALNVLFKWRMNVELLGKYPLGRFVSRYTSYYFSNLIRDYLQREMNS